MATAWLQNDHVYSKHMNVITEYVFMNSADNRNKMYTILPRYKQQFEQIAQPRNITLRLVSRSSNDELSTFTVVQLGVMDEATVQGKQKSNHEQFKSLISKATDVMQQAVEADKLKKELEMKNRSTHK
jgi:hypothetical protein